MLEPSKKPAPPPKEPERGPTPQGTFDHSPPGTLDRIAEKAHVVPDALSTVTITSATESPYLAIIEYAGMCKYPASATDDEPKKSLPFFIAPEDAYELAWYDTDSDSDDDSSYDSGPSGRREKSMKREASVPKFMYGLGQTEIMWPPPPELQADKLVEERDANANAKKKSSDTDAAATKADGAKADDAKADATKADATKADGIKADDIKADITKADGIKADITKADDVKADGVNQSQSPSDVVVNENTDGAADTKNAPDGVTNDVNATSPDNTGTKGPTSTDESSETAKEGEEEVKRTTIYLAHYSVGEPLSSNNGGFKTHREILVATPEGPERLRAFVQEVMQWHIDKDHREAGSRDFALYRFKSDGGGGYWSSEGFKKARPHESVVLADGQMEAILADVRRFLQPACKKWYAKHGLPRRRSYLFYGPPGTGKTSTIRAIASKFRFNCCFLSMTNCGFSNQQLCDALSQIPSNALLVLEDVDALFNENRKNEQGASLTFSGMLNALDGVVSMDGVITTMTTNHIERLDKALIRGGRVDRRFHFGHPTQKQIERLFLTFYAEAPRELAKKFAEAVFSRSEGQELRSIATLQQLFIQHRESTAEECTKGLDEFCETHFPEGTKGETAHIYT